MTVDKDTRFPEYRAPSGWMGGLAVPTMGLVGITAGLAQLSRSGAPLWLLLGLPVFLILLFVLMGVSARRLATTTGPAGITVKRPFGVRSTAWPDIQAIEIHSDPSAAVDSGVIAEHVVLYDRDGRRMMLPHLNSKTVPTLRQDVERLRALWEQLRGEAWVALPAVTEKIAATQRRTNRARGILVGMVVGAGVLMVGLVVFLVLVLTGALGDTGESTLPVTAVVLAVMGTVAGVVFGRRQARRAEAPVPCNGVKGAATNEPPPLPRAGWSRRR
jgi:Bacterial PH domain